MLADSRQLNPAVLGLTATQACAATAKSPTQAANFVEPDPEIASPSREF